MKLINGTINLRKKNIFQYPIISRILENNVFSYDPSFPGLHLIPISVNDVQTYELSVNFIDSLDLSYIKKTDTVIFLLQFEGWMHFFEYLDRHLKSKYNFENIFYASEQLNFNEIPKNEKPNINHLFFLSQDTWQPKKNFIEIPYSYELKDKIFLCYNRRSAPHRCQLVSLMNAKNLLENSFVSFDVKNAHETIQNDVFLSEFKKDFFLKNLPNENLTIEKYIPNSLDRKEYIQIERHHVRSMISIVTETHFYESELSFTEKIYRPISLGHPFIVVGRPGYLKKLRDFGFKTFDGLIDEKYDTIHNPILRIEEIVRVMEHFYNMNDSERKTICERMNIIAQYNLSVFHKKEFVKNTSLNNFLFSYNDS